MTDRIEIADEPPDSFLNDVVRLLLRYAGRASVGALTDEINRLRRELKQSQEPRSLPEMIKTPEFAAKVDVARERLDREDAAFEAGRRAGIEEAARMLDRFASESKFEKLVPEAFQYAAKETRALAAPSSTTRGAPPPPDGIEGLVDDYGMMCARARVSRGRSSGPVEAARAALLSAVASLEAERDGWLRMAKNNASIVDELRVEACCWYCDQPPALPSVPNTCVCRCHEPEHPSCGSPPDRCVKCGKSVAPLGRHVCSERDIYKKSLKALVEVFDALWRRYQYVEKVVNLSGEMNQLRLAAEEARSVLSGADGKEPTP